MMNPSGRGEEGKGGFIAQTIFGVLDEPSAPGTVPESPERPTGGRLRESSRSSDGGLSECGEVAVPMLTRTDSAKRMQAAARRHSARRALATARNAAIYVQRLMRGWRSRRRIRLWQRAIRAVIAGERAAQVSEQRVSALSLAQIPPPHSRTPMMTPPSLDVATPPARLTHDKSGQFTMRLLDNAAARAPAAQFSPSHFDCVATSEVPLHDALYESGKTHFRAGHLERALVDFQLVRTTRGSHRARRATGSPRQPPLTAWHRVRRRCARSSSGSSRARPSATGGGRASTPR